MISLLLGLTLLVAGGLGVIPVDCCTELES
jgi:hypothetical protein